MTADQEARRGPAESLLAGMRRIGVGERTLKTAFAAGLAYWLGSRIPGAQSSYLAPVTAILVMQLTIVDSVSIGVQRLLGVVVGIPVALAIASVVGVNALSVAMVVVVGFAIGSAFRLTTPGVQQVAITALLVMLVDSPHASYAYTRIMETVIGGAVGILVNALLLPPSHVSKAAQDIAQHGESVAALLADTADALDAGFPPDRAEALIQRARASEVAAASAAASLKQAMGSQRFNLLARSEAATIVRWTSALELVRRTRIQSMGIVRTLYDATTAGAACWPTDPGIAKPLAQVLRACSDEVRASLAVASQPSGQTREAFAIAASASESAVASLVATEPGVEALGREAWLEFAAVVTDVRRIAQEGRDFVATVRDVG